MSMFPNFTIDLRHEPFDATVGAVCEACALRVGSPGSVLKVLTIFFPLDKLEQVQRIADALNEISKPVASPDNSLAA